MKNLILSESQVKKIIKHILSEQNEVRSEALTVDFDAIWEMGKWKLTPQQTGPIVQKLTQITDFIDKNRGSLVTIQIEAGESQVTNFDREVAGKVPLDPGVLSQRRGDTMVDFLKQYFEGLVGKGSIDKMPEIPKPITRIGTTPYTKNSKDLETNKAQYQQEQFVRAIVTAKKDYDCIVGMEITIGYFNGKNRSSHTCDEAIFELRMNGVSIGEVNLNNSVLDTKINMVNNYNTRAEEKYNKLLDKALKKWDELVASGIEKDSRKAKENYIQDMTGGKPEPMEIPEWMTEKAAAAGYQDINQFVADVTKINDAFKSYGRKTDNAGGGSRSQTFVLDGAKAKSIIDNAPSDKIVLSIIPLVSKDGKYKIFYTRGSHADTPWVIIKTKKSETPLFNGEPNIGMRRGSTEETILLQTDLCGNPIKK